MSATAEAGPNPLHPSRMTSKERLAEACDLLALGLVRLRSRQSSGLSADLGESSLHIPPGQSGHAKRPRRRPA